MHLSESESRLRVTQPFFFFFFFRRSDRYQLFDYSVTLRRSAAFLVKKKK
jgi:hypothetical protein